MFFILWKLLGTSYCLVTHILQNVFLYVQDGAEYGSRVASSEKTLQFFVFYLVFLLFYVLDVVCITVYDRHTRLNIGSSVAQCKPDFRVLECRCFVHRHRIRALRLGCKTEKTQAEKREESWRPRQTETPCFPTSSSNHFAG